MAQRKNFKEGVGRGYSGSTYTLGEGIGRILGAIPRITGDIGASIASLAETAPHYLRRVLDDAADHGKTAIQIGKKGKLEQILESEPESIQKQLAKLVHEDEDVSYVSIPLPLAESMYAALIRQQKAPRQHHRYAAVFFALFFLLLGVVSFDYARVTGYAFLASSGISYSGFYSFLGFAFLGISLFAFAHSERKSKK